MENVTNQTLEVIKYVALLLSALIPVLKSIGTLKKTLEKDDSLKQFIVTLLFTCITLILPCLAIISFSIDWVGSYLIHRIEDDGRFVYQLVTVVSTLAAIYPLIWGIYIYPFYQKIGTQKLINLLTGNNRG